MMEIGSIYEINPAAVLRKDQTAEMLQLREILKYRKQQIIYTASGREAIALALRSLEKSKPSIEKSCLLPAYMCDTVFFPFKQAGWEISFYHVTEHLEPEEELLIQMENHRPGLLFVHCYYGVDTWKRMRSFLNKWKSEGVCIMEDVTQSYYLEGIGVEADYVIGSLRKWYPVPDGGFAASDLPLDEHGLQESMEFSADRLKLLTDKWEYLYGEGSAEEKQLQKQEYLKRNRETEDWLDNFDQITAMSLTSKYLLMEQKEAAAKEKRKYNCQILCEGLAALPGFAPVFKDAVNSLKDTAPLYWPIYAEDRASLQEHLQMNGIYAPVLWPIGKENEKCLSDTEKYIFNHLLAIPLDQRYGEEQMNRILSVMGRKEG